MSQRLLGDGGQGGPGGQKQAPTWFPTGIDVQNQVSHKVQIESAFVLRLRWGREASHSPGARGRAQDTATVTW